MCPGEPRVPEKIVLRQSSTGAMTEVTWEMGDALSMVVIWAGVTTFPVNEKLQLPKEDSGMSPVMLLLVKAFRPAHIKEA